MICYAALSGKQKNTVIPSEACFQRMLMHALSLGAAVFFCFS